MLGEIIQAISTNIKWIISVLLLIGTFVVSRESYKMQIRNGMRESIEQLEPDSYGTPGFTKLILHNMNYRFLSKSEIVIAIKFFSWSKQAGTATYRSPEDFITGQYAPIGQREEVQEHRPDSSEVVEEAIERIDSVHKAETTGTDILVHFSAKNAQNARLIAEKCLRTTHKEILKLDEEY